MYTPAFTQDYNADHIPPPPPLPPSVPLPASNIHMASALQVCRRPFLKGDGFDFYVDLGCGMPYCCTVTKVFVRMLGTGDQVRHACQYSALTAVNRYAPSAESSQHTLWREERSRVDASRRNCGHRVEPSQGTRLSQSNCRSGNDWVFLCRKWLSSHVPINYKPRAQSNSRDVELIWY